MATTKRQSRTVSRPSSGPLYRYCRGLFLLWLLLAAVVHGQDAEAELQTGIALTRQSQFQDAIPHFLAARGRARETFALEFDLALCYVGTRAFQPAIQILTGMAQDATHEGEINDLLAQAYIGNHQPDFAMQSFAKAVEATPKNEKLYLHMAEAFYDEALYRDGLQVVEIGLSNLHDSTRLLFERGLFRSQLDRPDLAKADFERVRTLDRGSDIAWIAAAEEAFQSADMPQAVRICRDGIRTGRRHYLLLTMFGEALLRG
jgi:tetratricopeptide (TPR) repeat protein